MFMDYNFFGNLFKGFAENEFLLIDGFFDKKEVDSNSKYVGVYKYVGNYIYCIILINDKVCTEGYEFYINLFKDKTEKVFSKSDMMKIIFLNIVITDNIDGSVNEFLNTFYFDIEKSINDLCWFIDCGSKKIISGKNQPGVILNIHKIINNAFYDNENISGFDFYQISDRVKQKKETLLKSNDNFVTFIILIINLIVFAVMELNGGSENIQNLIDFGALYPEMVFENGEIFRLFTNMFVHIGFAHIASNSLSLYILGTRSERYFGKILFLSVYLLSGVGASVMSLLFTNSISAGASGAIFGIMGAMLTHSAANGKSMGGFSAYFMVLFSLINIGAGFFMSGVDNAGHIGGFLTGCIISFLYNLFQSFGLKKH